METALSERELRRLDIVKSTPFFLVHAIALLGIFHFGWSWSGFGLAVALYYLRMFGVTAGYHRYFSHRAYKTSRVFQFVLALLAMSSVQKGVLWWASHHRLHHKLSDQPGDVHSVKLDGFYWSHVGWILSPKFAETDVERVKDLAKYPELRFLDRWFFLPAVAFAVITWLFGSWWGLYWGFFVSTTLLWHGTFTINSLTHMFGRRRYQTTDNSRNSAILAVVTMGEGWHNNHHYYQRSANQGFYWWEFDPSYYVLKALELFRIVWDVQAVPEHVRESHRVESASAKPVAEPATTAPVIAAPPPVLDTP